MRSKWTRTIAMTLALMTGVVAIAEEPAAPNCATVLDPRQRADELYAWITLRHPLIHAAIRDAQKIDFLFDMLQVPTGWMLPPPTTFASAYQYWDLSVRYNVLWKSHGRVQKELALDADAATRASRQSDDFRISFVRVMLARSFELLHVLANPNNRYTVDGNPHMCFKAQRLYPLRLSAKGTQMVRLEWGGSFTEEQFREVARLDTFLDDVSVKELVQRRVLDNLEDIAHTQQRLITVVGHARTCSAFRIEFAKFLKSSAGHMIEESPVRPVARLPAVDPAVIPQPSVEPAPFDEDEIKDFLEESEIALPIKYDGDTLRRLRTEFRRAVDLASTAMSDLGRWSFKAPAWQSLREAFAPNPTGAVALTRNLITYRETHAKTLLQYRAAEKAFTKLRDWLELRRRQIGERTPSRDEASLMSARDLQTLQAVLTDVERLRLLLTSTVPMLEQRQVVIEEYLTSTVNISVLAMLVQQQWLSGVETPPELQQLREALEALANPEGETRAP